MSLLPAVSATRSLRQAQDRTAFPGCTFLADSEIATNPDYSILYYYLQQAGLTQTLLELDAVVTLFAPTNAAFSDYGTMHNMTFDQAMTEPLIDDNMLLIDTLMYHITREALIVSLQCQPKPNAQACVLTALHAALSMHLRTKCLQTHAA